MIRSLTCKNTVSGVIFFNRLILYILLLEHSVVEGGGYLSSAPAMFTGRQKRIEVKVNHRRLAEFKIQWVQRVCIFYTVSCDTMLVTSN